MKKILFLQIKGNSLGGVWTVNKSLSEEFIKRGYKVNVFSFRNNHPGIDIDDLNIEITTINKEDPWEIIHKRDVINSIKKKCFLKTLKQYILDNKKLKNDYKKMKKKINELQPDYIIASHYQTLISIPKNLLKRTIFVQHTSFNFLLMDKNNIKVLKKYNDKLFRLCWLCESTMKRAKEFGFKKNTYIYNPNKFMTDKITNAVKNKKISVITRIHPEKRIDLMIDMVNDVLNEINDKEWKFEIYGIGAFNQKSQNILNENSQISYRGITDDVINVLLKSSLTLNTSIYEGFSLSIIEAFSCGVPVIAFNFGESSHEQIINDYNGYVIENDNIDEFKKTLKNVINNQPKLEKLSKNAKEFSKNFSISKIGDQWIRLFSEMEE